MNNEFVKVHNEQKTALLHATMQWKQQQCRFEIFSDFQRILYGECHDLY